MPSYKNLVLQIYPNYAATNNEKSLIKKVNEIVNSITVNRLHVNSEFDMKVVDGNPIRKQVKFLGYH